MADILNKFVEQVRVIYGPNLKSVVLYGSKASGEDTKKHSDYNLLLILGDIKFGDLKSLNKIIKFWIKGGNQPPLLFTTERLKKSADVFPIEFLDMKDNHKVLYGEDPFDNLEIKNTHLRHECEFELKGKLLKLQQGYVVSRNKSDVRNLLIKSVTTFLILFRHIVRLFNEVPPAKRLDALNILSGKTGLNPSVFVTIFNMKRGDKDVLKLDPEPVMKEYLEEIEKMVEVVDSRGN
ncbi:MAG: hypothetical protein Q7K21_06450 [Elusimicrobiota bacterium]|nr:hypothetical protein [Elusimicrobiota bacterium]